jgi:hypothetical protein
MNRPRRPGLGGNSNERRSGGFLAWLFRNFFALVLIGGIIYYFGLPALRQVGNGPQAAPPSAEAVELATTASINRQALTVAKFNQRQLLALHDEVKRAFDEWEKELAAWEKEGPPLLRSDDGKRIAADGAQVKRFRGVFRQDRPSSDALASARRAAEELVTPIREALRNPEDASTPDATISSTLRTLQTEARKASDSYRDARDSVRAMLARTKGPASAKTLQDAIAALDQEEAAERAADIDAAEKKTRDEGARRVAEAKAQLAKEIADAEATRIRNEQAKKKQATDLATAKTVEEMELKQREAGQEIARIRDAAELKRQGALISGSVWKGTHTERGALHNMTLTVMSRTRDQIQVEIKLADARAGLNVGTFNFQGTVKGNSIRLSKAGENAPPEIEATYNPSAQTISGAWVEGSSPFNLKLRQGD